MDNPRQKTEAKRLEALRRYNVLDMPSDTAIDNIAKVAADICETPIALVTLIDSSRQWFKVSIGLSITEAPREPSFCSHAIEDPNMLMVVEDATKDSRFKDHPLVVGEPNLRFYSGKPLVSPDGYALGTLCVMDYKPRQLTPVQEKALSRLADVVMDLLSRQESSMSTAVNLAIEHALPHGITITDSSKADNPMVYVNKVFESLTGYSKEELLGRNCRFLQGENTDPFAVEQLRTAVLHQREATVALKNYRKDGTDFWNEITVSPIVDKNAETTHFIGIQRDVSERYKIEAALSQSRTFLESAPDAMIFSDSVGDIKMANSETARLFGYSLDELSKMNVDDLATEQYRAYQKEYRARFISEPELREKGIELDVRGLTKSGKELMLDVRLSPIKSDDGMLISASIRDISAKVAAEAELLRAQDQYRDLFENSSDLIQSVNPNGSFAYTNPAWLKALGYTQQEASQISIMDIVCPSNLEHCQNLFDQILKGESIPHISVVSITKLGKQIYLEGSVNTSVIDGQVHAIRTIFRDVTKGNETERQLVLSKEFAEKATTAKSRFLAAASHDLRQPLQSASMYVATLARQFDNPDEVKELSEMTGKSLNAMGRLLDVLLDISKLDTGSITPEKKDVSIQGILENIVTSNQQQAAQKGLQFNCEYQESIVYTDAVLLERIIENFVSNAIRYTDHGHVNIECHQREDGILIAVNDSGIGIPSDKQDDVFEEYYQLDNQARDRRKGLGLGLSIVKRVADLLGYPLEVSSELGNGSTFSVLVPLGEAKLVNVIEPKSVEVNEAVVPIVLLVDDDESVLKSIERLLKAYDMEVHSAPSGDEALAMVSNGLDPDFILSDFRLPHYDGIELVERIRDKLSRDIPTAVMTGDTSTARIKNAKLPNFTVLNKPIDLSQLVGLINDSI